MARLTPKQVKQERQASLERQGVVEPEAAGRILGREMARQLRPYIEKLRRKVWGSTNPLEDPKWNPARDEALHALGDPVGKIAEATGFNPSHVLRWILTGEQPTLHRAVVHTDDRRVQLPDGPEIRRRYVSLVLNAPIHEHEIRRIWGEYLRPAWGDIQGDGDRLRGREFSDLDDHLHRLIVVDEDGSPKRTWAEILNEWRDTPADGWTAAEWKDGPGDVAESTLRVRWFRLQNKLDALHSEEETNDG